MRPIVLALRIAVAIAVAFDVVSVASAQELSPLATLQSYDLATIHVGRATVYHDSNTGERARQIADLGESAATFFEDSFGTSFDFGVAALSPDRWFTEYQGQPYAIPWNSMSERLVIVPASLTEGVLVEGKSQLASRRLSDYFLLHEYGHLFAKRYFRPTSDQDYLEVAWFEELLANYFAYSYVKTTDAEWAETLKQIWTDGLESFTPSVLSLDWSYMNRLTPPEVARDYNWYQQLINRRAAGLFEQHGIRLMHTMKASLSWNQSTHWTAEVVLSELENLLPGFRQWAENPAEGLLE